MEIIGRECAGLNVPYLQHVAILGSGGLRGCVNKLGHQVFRGLLGGMKVRLKLGDW